MCVGIDPSCELFKAWGLSLNSDRLSEFCSREIEIGKGGSMDSLAGKIALVSGASRGIGKGIAIALAAGGVTVYITGRTETEFAGSVQLSGSIHSTAQLIQSAGGTCIPLKCDHLVDAEVEAVFSLIKKDRGKLDVLVNNVWGGYEHFNDGSEFWTEKGFWDMPLPRWAKSFDAGVRAHFVSSCFATRMMLEAGSGLIVNISFWAADRTDKGVAYSAAKAATNKMSECMAFELRDKNVCVLTLYPGLVRTEAVMKAREHFDLSNSESPEFAGLVIGRLATDKQIMARSGSVLVVADLAKQYAIVDIDGKQPRPLRKEEA